MKLNKLYVKVNIISLDKRNKPVQRHLLIRVDDISGFKKVIESDGFKQYFFSLNGLILLNKLEGNIQPYRINLDEEEFDYMRKEVNRKIGSGRKYMSDTFELVSSSTHKPCIVIGKFLN